MENGIKEIKLEENKSRGETRKVKKANRLKFWLIVISYLLVIGLSAIASVKIYKQYFEKAPVVLTAEQIWAGEHPKQMKKAIDDWASFSTRLQEQVAKAENDYLNLK